MLQEMSYVVRKGCVNTPVFNTQCLQTNKQKAHKHIHTQVTATFSDAGARHRSHALVAQDHHHSRLALAAAHLGVGGVVGAPHTSVVLHQPAPQDVLLLG